MTMKNAPALSPLDLLRTQSMTSVIEDEIEKMILQGQVVPGQRLNENALASRLGISRGPIREACRALAEKGLVYLIPNRGVFIREISLDEAAEVYNVRAALFGEAGKLFAERITDGQIAELRDLIERMEKAAKERDFETYYPLNLELHGKIMDGAGNATLKRLYRGLVKELHLFRTRGLVQGGGLAVSNSEHRAMVEALAARDPEAARRTHYGHVITARERMLSAEAPSK